MSRSPQSLTRLHRTIAAALIALAAALSLASAAHAGPAAPSVPTPRLEPGAGHKVFLVGHAVGVQIHACNGSAWSFVAPRADLYGDNGKLLMTHGAGPVWTAKDGSSVSGARIDGATVDQTAIPWLLLSAKPVAGGDDGRLSATTHIQRVATTGGLTPPAGECTPATAGTVKEVPYTADYYFWKRTG